VNTPIRCRPIRAARAAGATVAAPDGAEDPHAPTSAVTAPTVSAPANGPRNAMAQRYRRLNDLDDTT
jgi:hypothetical protein